MSGAELKAERERCKKLKFFGEAQGPIEVLRPVALPAFKASHAVLAGAVALVIYHKQYVALHPAGRLWLLVVRTVHVQIVVDVHGNGVLSVPKPVEGAGSVRSVLTILIQTRSHAVLLVFMKVFQTSCIIHTSVY